MQKKYIIATSAALVILVAGALTYKVYADKNEGVAAIVNNEKISVEEVKNAYEQNPQIKAQVPFEEFYDHAIDVMVNSKLASQAAKASNIAATPEYQKQLATLQDELARQMYIDKLVKEAVTDEAVKKVYDDYVAQFKSQKEIKAKHILVETEQEAKDIIKKLDEKSAKFDDLARQYSKDQPDLGYFTKEMMVPEFSEVAFTLDKGTYSKVPAKTEFGYHVIYVEDVRDSKPLPLQDIEQQIRSNLSQSAVAQIVEKLNAEGQVEKYDLKGKKIEPAKVESK